MTSISEQLSRAVVSMFTPQPALRGLLVASYDSNYPIRHAYDGNERNQGTTTFGAVSITQAKNAAKLLTDKETGLSKFKELQSCAMQHDHNLLRLALVYATVALDGQIRERRKEALIFHSLRVANQTAKDLGPKHYHDVIVAVLHDVVEDSVMYGPNNAATQALYYRDIKNLFGQDIANRVQDLTINIPAEIKSLQLDDRAEFKHQFKLQQAANFRNPGDLVVKGNDNYDDVHSNVFDFAKEQLIIRNGMVYVNDARRPNPPAPVSVNELALKLEHRIKHHQDYIKRLLVAAEQDEKYGADYAAAATKLDSKFMREAQQLDAILTKAMKLAPIVPDSASTSVTPSLRDAAILNPLVDRRSALGAALTSSLALMFIAARPAAAAKPRMTKAVDIQNI